MIIFMKLQKVEIFIENSDFSTKHFSSQLEILRVILFLRDRREGGKCRQEAAYRKMSQ